jgi:hypothetical protein
MYIKFSSEDLKGRYYSEDLGVNVRMMDHRI